MSELAAPKQDQAVIVLDGLNFLFYEREIEKALFLWEAGISWLEMVNRIRPVDTNMYRSYSVREAEVFMLFVHLGLEGRLRERPGKMWGIK